MAIKRLPATGDAPRTTGVPPSLVPGGETDSAGFPWSGRSFDHHETAFADDDGSAPEELIAAITELRGIDASSSEAVAVAQGRVLEALSGSRVLIPLLAEAGDFGTTPEGRTVEKTQELSIVTVTAPDGRSVMPVFSSVRTLRAWNPEARPIPVPAPQAALAAAQEHTDLIILDPGSPQSEFGVRRTQLEGLATRRWGVAPWLDAEVLQAFRSSLACEASVIEVQLKPGDPDARLLAPEIEVVLTLIPGLSRSALDSVLASIQQHWAASEVIVERIDSMRVVLR